jgi:glutaminyl-tRNA synthetase
MPLSNRKVKATIHWLSASHALQAEIRLFDRLFNVEMPDNVDEGQDYKDHLNPDSLKVVQGFVENSFAEAKST